MNRKLRALYKNGVEKVYALAEQQAYRILYGQITLYVLLFLHFIYECINKEWQI